MGFLKFAKTGALLTALPTTSDDAMRAGFLPCCCEGDAISVANCLFCKGSSGSGRELMVTVWVGGSIVGGVWSGRTVSENGASVWAWEGVREVLLLPEIVLSLFLVC